MTRVFRNNATPFCDSRWSPYCGVGAATVAASLLLAHGLQIGRPGFEVAADEPIHVEKQSQHLREVRRRTVHGPGDLGTATNGLEIKRRPVVRQRPCRQGCRHTIASWTD